MKLAVTDACIFIDLLELDIVGHFFRLEIEIHTTVDVLNELFPEQKQLLRAYEAGGRLAVHNLQDKDFHAMAQIPFPRGLSPQDRTVIYLAENLGGALVISSDNVVRGFATARSLECHGLLWVFDELVKSTILSPTFAAGVLKRLLKLNQMYTGVLMKKELEKRIQSWEGK